MSSSAIFSLVIGILAIALLAAAVSLLLLSFLKRERTAIKDGEADLEIIEREKARREKEKRKGHKALKVLGKVGSSLFLALALVLAAFSIRSMATDNPLIGNVGTLVIGSNSMSGKHPTNDYLLENDLNNQFSTYDLIGLTRYEKEEDVKLYDVVAYRSVKGPIIVHRVIAITETDEGLGFITRGDMNVVSDPGTHYSSYLHFEDVIGYYNNFWIPSVGLPILFLQSPIGLLTLVAIVYSSFFYSIVMDKKEEAEGERLKEILKVIPYDFESDDLMELNKKVTLLYRGQTYEIPAAKHGKGQENGTEND